MSAVNLADMKAHLRVSFDSEDTYIQSLIDAAESYVDSIGVGFDSPIQDALVHAIKLIVGHWYQNREAAAETPPKAIAFGVDMLLAPHREISL